MPHDFTEFIESLAMLKGPERTPRQRRRDSLARFGEVWMVDLIREEIEIFEDADDRGLFPLIYETTVTIIVDEPEAVRGLCIDKPKHFTGSKAGLDWQAAVTAYRRNGRELAVTLDVMAA